jgi:hypothetical protein
VDEDAYLRLAGSAYLPPVDGPPGRWDGWSVYARCPGTVPPDRGDDRPRSIRIAALPRRASHRALGLVLMDRPSPGQHHVRPHRRTDERRDRIRPFVAGASGSPPLSGSVGAGAAPRSRRPSGAQVRNLEHRRASRGPGGTSAVGEYRVRPARRGGCRRRTCRWGPVRPTSPRSSSRPPTPDLRGTDQRLSRNAAIPAGHDAAAGEIWLDDWTLGYGAERSRSEPAPWGPAAAAQAGGSQGRPWPCRSGGRRDARFRDPASFRHRDAWARRAAVALTGWRGSTGSGARCRCPAGPLLRDRLVLHLSDGTDLSLCGRGGATGAASRRWTVSWWRRTERCPAWTTRRCGSHPFSEVRPVPTSWHIVRRRPRPSRATFSTSARITDFGQSGTSGSSDRDRQRDGRAWRARERLLCRRRACHDGAGQVASRLAAYLCLVPAGSAACQEDGATYRSDTGIVPSRDQRPGDPEAGYTALVNAPYVSCGIPMMRSAAW